ncbi:unnamed protein product [Cylicostephanus goldi]|uniref:Uncharacterized protein n=1 Tax=Cylicostephanus goldi TaxID=71465 RepID=A0A3P7QTY6_CYLGO|nr:unnamed protein product [Cylicostephanus goldi]
MAQRVMVAVPPPTFPPNGSYHNEHPLPPVPPPPAAPAHPAMVPIVQLPVVMPSPTHHPMSSAPPTAGNPQMVMLPPGMPPRGMVMNNHPRPPQPTTGLHPAAPPPPPSLWSTHPPPPRGAVLMPPLNSPPSHPQPQFWVHPPPALYAFDPSSDNGYVWSSTQRPDLGLPPPPLPSTRANDQMLDTEQLMMKRNEIIKSVLVILCYWEEVLLFIKF